MEKKKFKTATLLAIALIALASCSSTPKNPPPDDATDTEIIQLAQDAYEKGKRKLARYYYTVLLQRYGMDTADYVEGRFELAHLYMKEKDYELAVPMLEEVIEICDISDYGTVPTAFRKLAELDLAKVPPKRLEQIRAAQSKDLQSQQSYHDSYGDYGGYEDYGDTDEDDGGSFSFGSDWQQDGDSSRNGYFSF